MNADIEEILEYIEELESESSVPRNIKAKLTKISTELKKTNNDNLLLITNKLLSDLDDISGDANLDSYTRQQIWSITSMLEGLNLE